MGVVECDLWFSLFGTRKNNQIHVIKYKYDLVEVCYCFLTENQKEGIAFKSGIKIVDFDDLFLVWIGQGQVKTTNPKKYSVRPNTGMVLPRSTCDIIGAYSTNHFVWFVFVGIW